MAHILILAGGTGGHVYPALAVARALEGRGWEVTWMGAPDSFEARVVPQAGFELVTIDAHRLRGQGAAELAKAPFRLARAVWQAGRRLRAVRPDLVLGMGGFVAAPGGLAARLAGVPLVIHEQNAVPGLTNRLLARLATRVLQAFPDSFPESVGAVTTGNPLRAELLAVAPPAERMAGRGKARRILVLGGSLGAQALNEVVPEALARLNRELQIRHQAGRGKAGQAAAGYRRCGLEAEVTEYIDDMAEAYAWADLAICRAGAITVSELAAVGLGAVLVPYPHAVDDHQSANARHLEQVGAALVLPQASLTPEVLAQLLRPQLAERYTLREMAEAARRAGRPDATEAVADQCEAVVA